MSLTITSRAFQNGIEIPKIHTWEGEDISPPLSWEGEPKHTVTFALIMEDEDTDPPFTHWIVYNLPADCHSLEKIMPIEKKLKNRAIQGKNDFGKYGYKGPCPPKGERHQYVFRLFALKKKLSPESANTREDFYQAIEGHIIDKATYKGTYKLNKQN